MSNDPPEIHWARRFPFSERLFLAVYFCSVPILISGLLICLHWSRRGYVALALSALGVAWVSHRLGRRRYAITSEAVDVDLAPIGRWKVEKREVPLRDVLLVSVKPMGNQVYSKAVVYHRNAGPPLALDFLTKHETLAATKMIAYYGEIQKAEPTPEVEPMPEGEPMAEANPLAETDPIPEAAPTPEAEPTAGAEAMPEANTDQASPESSLPSE
jgi:hypothetical protein